MEEVSRISKNTWDMNTILTKYNYIFRDRCQIESNEIFLVIETIYEYEIIEK